MARLAGDGETTNTVKLPDYMQPVAPPPPIPTTDPRIQASLDANPFAAGAPGTLFTYSGVGTPDNPGPAGTTNYGNPNITQAGTTDPSQDWASAFFGSLGLPDDVKNAVVQILREHAQDASLAQALALQYIRSTPWYQIHYPGALEGIAKGVINSEADYASYLNQINLYSRQYLGRDVSGDEVSGYLKAGYDPGYVGKLYAGQAYVAANAPNIQYLEGAFGPGRLDQASLTALGNENSGIDTALGQKLQNGMQRAQQMLTKLFSSNGATPASLGVGKTGLAANGLLGTNQTPDVGA